jgi:hypothetical protein
MADGKLCEVLTAPVLNSELVGKTICECYNIMRAELDELKSELNSCREVIKIQASLVIRDLTLRVFAIIRFRGENPPRENCTVILQSPCTVVA